MRREQKLQEDNLIKTLLNLEKTHRELTENYNLEALSGVAETVAALGNISVLRGSRKFEQKILGISNLLEARYGVLEAVKNRYCRSTVRLYLRH